MLIKDPYLNSVKKDIDIHSHQNVPQVNNSYSGQSMHSEMPRGRAASSGQVDELKGKVKAYQK